jgi:Undecaprenyl-phosphate glucose phosphotransferase
MGFFSTHKNAGGEFEVRTRAVSPALDISSSEAVSLPAVLIDGIAIFLVGNIVGIIYASIVFHSVGQPGLYSGTSLLVAVLFCGATRIMGAANPMSISHDFGRARLALFTWLATFLFLMVVAFSLKIGPVFSRGSVISFFAFGLPVVIATRVFAPRLVSKSLFGSAYRSTEVIIATPRGSPSLAPLSFELRSQGCAGVHTIEFDNSCSNAQWPVERQQLLKRIIETARVAGPGEIYLLGGSVAPERVSSILKGLRLVPRGILVVPDETVANLFSLPVRRMGPNVAVEMQREPLSAIARTCKRGIDIVVAGAALIFLAPAFLAIAIAIKTDSSGPVFFRQSRNGHRGRPFRIFKFRTMTVMEDGAAVTQVKRNDHRVTRVGRFLRKTSIDELPQLLNILSGEMSLVGPRPHPISLDELYGKAIENYELRQHVKPGVTGWAQVNGLRGETPTVDLMFRRIEFDLWYAANCSLALDIQILVRTLFVVLSQDNAY